MRVFLIGFMSAGKTTLGARVAERMSVPFFDLDGLVERREGKSIPQIFAEEGEPRFRAVESETLRALVASEPSGVVATGGGTFTVEANRKLIRASGLSVWLDVSADELLERGVAASGSASGGRPLFTGREQALRLYEARRSVYALADERILLDGASVDDDAERLYAFLSERIEIS